MKIFSNIKKLLSIKTINQALAKLTKLNKPYMKDNDKETLKQYMMGALVGISIGVISKETKKTSTEDFMNKLNKSANSKLMITVLNQKAQFK